MNAIIIDGKAYTAESSHPDVIASCHVCDLYDYCEHSHREVCAAIAEPTDHFKFSQPLTDKLK